MGKDLFKSALKSVEWMCGKLAAGACFVYQKTGGILPSISLVIFIALSAVFLAVICSQNPNWIFSYIGVSNKYEALKFLGIGMGGVLVALQAFASNRRARAMEDTVKKTEQGLTQERLKNAIEHLGHTSDSVRLGSAYELLNLARDTEPLRKTVLEILCAHIRQTTSRDDYQKMYDSKPSVEIQSLLTLLFVQNHEVFAGIGIDLQGSWLNGVNLDRAHLAKANLQKTHLREAYFVEAHLQNSNFANARMQGTLLPRAQLQNANFSGAGMQRANLTRAKLQYATFDYAYLQKTVFHYAELHRATFFLARMQGANLNRAQLNNVDFYLACLQGANFESAQMQKAYLSHAQMQGVNLCRARLQGANLSSAHLQGSCLKLAELQGADLDEANFKGATSQQSITTHFQNYMLETVGVASDLSMVIFSGGLKRKDLDSIVEGLPDSEASDLRDRLMPHIDKPGSHQLPEDSDAITGKYTQQEAGIWIAEYKGALSEPSDENNS